MASQHPLGHALDITNISYVHHRKDGAPTLVLLHGMDSDLFTFDSVTEVLRKHFSLVLVDQRGHGRTIYDGFEISPEMMQQDLVVLLDHLAIETVHILGHSFGAFTAYCFAQSHPQRVLSLIIEDMGMSRRPPSESKEEMLARVLEISQKYPTHKEFSCKEEVGIFLREAGVPARRIASLLEKQCVINIAGKFSVFFRAYSNVCFSFYVQSLPHQQLKLSIATAHIPMLFVLAGNAESCVALDEMRDIRQFFGTQATLVRVPGSLHNVHKSAPAKFLENVLSFIQANSSERHEGQHTS